MAESPSVTIQGVFGDTRRDFIGDAGWVLGCDTLLFPTDIMQGSYVWGVNVTNRGGVIQTRPRRKRLFSVPGSIAQGFCEYLTLDQTQWLVFAVDGNVFASQYPFGGYSQIAGISMNPTAPRVYFKACVQAAFYNPDQTIAILPTPINYLFIQDGVSSPAWWDGTTAYQPYAGQISTDYTGVPIGTCMESSGGRLWVTVGRQVYASDYVIPTQFQEQTYLAEKSGFQFPRLVTALLQAPVDTGMFVFTDRGIYSLQSQIANRTQWNQTPNFQSTITEEVGCVAPFSPIYQHGLPWFYTAKGFLSMDMALQLHISNVLFTRDGEMRRSKAKLSPTLSGICTGLFENLLMVSVPHASQFNRHTWIQDAGVAPKLNSNAGACWSGVWTGTYPVQYATVIFNGVEHNYEFSYANGYIQDGSFQYPIALWENFLNIQNDDAVTPVRSKLETRMFRMPLDAWMQCCFVEVFVTHLSGVVTLDFSVAGIAGLYNKLSTSTFRSDIGPFFNPAMMTIYYAFPNQANTIIQSYRPQTRYPRSTEVSIQSSAASAHLLEVGTFDYIDRGFQVLLEWSGNMAIRAIRFYYRPYSTPAVGTLSSDESHVPRIVLDAV